MISKFSRFENRFRDLYEAGATYSEIAEKLGISILTVNEWRDKLDLPRRRRQGPLSWMDVRKVAGMSPREILEPLGDDLGFTRNEIPMILIRYDKLKQLGQCQGRNQVHLMLTAAYLYLRWEGSGRQPYSATKFVEVCQSNGYRISRATLLRLSRLFKDAKLFPSVALTPGRFLDRKWNTLKAKHDLPEDVRTIAVQLMLLPNFALGKSPEAVVSACVYVAALKRGIELNQHDLCAELGTTTISLRNVRRALEKILDDQSRGENILEVSKPKEERDALHEKHLESTEIQSSNPEKIALNQNDVASQRSSSEQSNSAAGSSTQFGS
jgi:transcription initiation factor TFIIIB Brf1 subunit/transcription initiation factor TFIIB